MGAGRHPAPAALLRRCSLAASCLLVTWAVFPQDALAHGIVGKAELPIPVWLFSWAAAIVLVVSFVALSTMWTKPRLQEQHLRRLFRLPVAFEWLASLVGLALFALVVYSGFAGAQVTQANFSVTFIYVIFWVGTPVASVLFGDVFRALSPWRTCGRVASALLRRARRGEDPDPLLRYPDWLGVWPAIGWIVGFAWLELVYVERDRPSTLAALSLGYFFVMLAGMALFGVEEWVEGPTGSACTSTCSRSSQRSCAAAGRGLWQAPFERRERPDDSRRHGRAHLHADRDHDLRRLLQRRDLAQKRAESAGTVRRSGLHPTPALELAYSLGLVLCILVIARHLPRGHPRRSQRQQALRANINCCTRSPIRSCRSRSHTCSPTTSRC